MAIEVRSKLGEEKYLMEITAGKNTLIADEPVEKGGGEKGFNPMELIASGLAACTSATLRMYIEHKGWSVPLIDVKVELTNDPENNKTIFTRSVEFPEAVLDENQKTRLKRVAERCPVHQLLEREIVIDTSLT